MAEVSSFPQFSPVRMRAASREAAVEQALQIVGAAPDEVEVEVIEDNNKGVTVRVSPRRASDVASSDATASDVPASDVAAAPTQSTLEPSAEPESTLSAAPSAVDADEVEARDDDEIEAVGDVEVDVDVVEAVADYAPPTPRQTRPSRPARPIDDAARHHATTAAQGMLDRMGLEASVSVADGPFSILEADDAEADSRLYLKIEGADVGILIGKHGQTLQSFQYLLNLTLNNRGPEDSESETNDALRVVVDAGGYRSRRASVLQQSAQEASARAKRDRRSIRMEPMPAHERRLVHMSLRDDETITTGSEGREPLRHVVISPLGVRPTPLNDRGGYNNRGNRGGNRGGFERNRSGFQRD